MSESKPVAEFLRRFWSPRITVRTKGIWNMSESAMYSELWGPANEQIRQIRFEAWQSLLDLDQIGE